MLTIFVVFAAIVGIYVIIDSGKGYDDYKDRKLSDAQHLSRATLQNISKTFTQEKGINERHLNSFYRCLSQGLYDKNNNLLVKNLVALCYEDYQDDHKMDTYYDTKELLSDFSRIDGSYRPAVKIIKKHIGDDPSLKIEDTIYVLHYNNTRPHMTVATKFKINSGRYEIQVDVDATTKELYNVR